METPFLDDENDKHDRKLVIYDTCPSGSVITNVPGRSVWLKKNNMVEEDFKEGFIRF